MRRDRLEAAVLNGLRDHLMRPEMVTAFVDEFHKELNREAAERDICRNRTEHDLEKTEREIRRLIEAIKSGVPGSAVKDEMTTLEARRLDLLARVEEALPAPATSEPCRALQQKVMNLAEGLNDEPTRLEAIECLRELIEEIRLVPENGKLRIELYGELASLINLANGHPRSQGTGVQVTLVAGISALTVTAQLGISRTHFSIRSFAERVRRFPVRSPSCHAVLFATLLSCSSSLPTALAEESTGPETRVVVGYRVDLDNFNLGSFRFTTTLNGSDYRVQGAGHFSILGGLLYDLRTITASSGKVTSTGPEPRTYMLSYAGGGIPAKSE